MLTSILFAFFLLILFLFGDSVLYRYFNDAGIKRTLSQRIAIAMPIAMGLHLFCSHALALVIHSYRLSSIIIFGILFLLLVLALSTKNYKFDFEIERSDIYMIVIALLICVSCGIRGHLTDSDNTHIAWVGSIVENNTYPPVLPINVDYPLTFYHYGIDLLISNIASLTGAAPWDAISLQVSIGSFLTVLAIFALISFFISSRLKAALATLFVFFYTAFMAIEFFYKFAEKLPGIPIAQFMKAWQESGLPSICHVSFYSTIVSQTVSLVALLALCYLLINFEEQGLKANIRIFISALALSFLSYFSYPSFWYVSFCGFGLYALIQCYRNFKAGNNTVVWNFVVMMICIFLAKYLTLKPSFTSYEDINALVIKPSLWWDHFAMNFFKYFPADPNTVRPITDFVSGKRIFEVYLFSMTTFRNFGLLTIVTLILMGWRAIKKDIDKSFILPLMGAAGLIVPFIVDYVLKPSETYRFPSWSKIVFLIFIVISLIKIVEQNEFMQRIVDQWFVKLILVFHVLLVTIPGLISISPFLGHTRYTNDELLNKEEKAGLKALRKIHKPDDIALADNIFYVFSDITNVAGFYGVGGQWYKPDNATRKTAIYLLNPVLLEELDVDYVLIDENDVLGASAKSRLADIELFDEEPSINRAHAGWHFYRFLNKRKYSDEEIAEFKSEYKWIIGTKQAMNFRVLGFGNNRKYSAQTREELEPVVKTLKNQIKKTNIPIAMWLGAQALSQREIDEALGS